MGRRALTVGVVASLMLAACGGGGDDLPAAGVPDDVPTATDACAAGERPALQGGSHLLGDAEPPVPYSSTPPTSGWHSSGAIRDGVIDPDDPLSDPEIVSVLEIGGVVASYDPDRVSSDDVATLEQLAEGSHAGRLTVTPYPATMPTPLALTAWGVLQRCETVDPASIDAFVLTYAGRTGADH